MVHLSITIRHLKAVKLGGTSVASTS